MTELNVTIEFSGEPCSTSLGDMIGELLAAGEIPRNPANGLTPAEIERLGMLAEEAAEIAQMCGKILRFGYESTHPDGGPTNRDLLVGEIQDLMAVLTLMTGKELGAWFEHTNAPASKIARKRAYSHFQKEVQRA